MRIYLLSICLLISLFKVHSGNYRDPIIVLSDTVEEINIGEQVIIFIDTTSLLSFDDILLRETERRFERSGKRVPNFGINSSAMWFKAIVENKSEKEWYLRVENAYLDTIELYLQKDDTFEIIKTGKNFNFKNRKIKAANFIFPIDVPKDSTRVMYLRVKHHMSFVPLQLGQSKPIFEAEGWYNLFYGCFFGILVSIIIANIIVYFSFRDISLVYYVLYTIGLGTYMLQQKGFFVAILPESLLWLSKYTPLSIYTAMITLPLFAVTFLQAKERSPMFYKICKFLIVFGIIVNLLFLIGFRGLSYIIILIFSQVTGVIMVIFPSIIFKNGYKPARFFMIAYPVSMITFAAIGLQSLGYIAPSFFTRNAIQIGSLWEIIFFSVAIGDKVYLLRKEKEKAQENALNISKENETLLLNQTAMLEDKVKQRTQELVKAQDQLISAAKQAENENIRRRISQDIHDDISSGLNRISWLGEMVKIKAMKGIQAEVLTSIEKIIRSSRETVDHLIEIIWSLNPVYDDLQSLLAYMRNYTSKFMEERSFDLILDFPELSEKIEINPELKRNLLLVMKEALNNAVKYSEAKTITLSFRQQNSHYFMCISDNGRGFREGVVRGTGNGMINMQRRMRDVNGILKVDTKEGQGTKVICQGPIY